MLKMLYDISIKVYFLNERRFLDLIGIKCRKLFKSVSDKCQKFYKQCKIKIVLKECIVNLRISRKAFMLKKNLFQNMYW